MYVCVCARVRLHVYDATHVIRLDLMFMCSVPIAVPIMIQYTFNVVACSEKDMPLDVQPLNNNRCTSWFALNVV